MKMNKQVNKMPWLSVTPESAEVDRHGLVCAARIIILVPDFLELQAFILNPD